MTERDGAGNGNGRGTLPRGRPLPTPRIPDGPRYSMDDLVTETGIGQRTIRFYINQGMLTPAHGRGPSATYDKDHLLRLRMIEELKAQHLPLREIKARLEDLETADLEAHFAIKAGPTEARWRRIEFGGAVEVHVRDREPRDYRFEAAVQEIVRYTRYVLDGLEESR